MKVTELMIGDWVNETIVGFHQWDVTDYPDFDEKYINPIPLTSEILKKNKLLHNHIDIDYDGWSIDIEPSSSWWLLTITHTIDDAWDYDVSDFPIYYVHELQHILRICGLNELADNIKV